MTSARRTAPFRAGAAVILLGAALTGCGTVLVYDDGSGSPSSAASPQGDEARGDAVPRYAENHAFQSTADLSGADRVRGEAEVEKVKRGLAALAEGRKSTEAGVFKVLHGLGYPDGTVTTGSFGPHRTSFTVSLGGLCVEGSLDGVVNGLVQAEAHGLYMEGTGCVKPQGGH
ncbi:hypothetical protein [Streptomyces sp. NPDC055992]|uniref:hypothetical protein n=1 Tax=Streptomyces sp. NPDC055992 TaxID=3345673 RepID=UPI0035E279F4